MWKEKESHGHGRAQLRGAVCSVGERSLLRAGRPEENHLGVQVQAVECEGIVEATGRRPGGEVTGISCQRNLDVL